MANFSGYKAPSFDQLLNFNASQYEGRQLFHLDPSVLRLGIITSSGQASVQVWNDGPDSASLTGVIVSDATQGISVQAAGELPIEIPAYSAIPITVTFDAYGTDEVDVTAFLSIGGSTVELHITGQRAAVWLHPHDWSHPFEERLQFLTCVIEAWDGTEQRAAVRDEPRLSYYGEYLVNDGDRRSARNLLWGEGGGALLVPYGPDRHRSASTIHQGVQSLSLPTEGSQYIEGGKAIIYNRGEFEVIEVSSVSDGLISLAVPVGREWPAGSYVSPAHICYIDGEVQVRQINGRVERIGMRWQREPGSSGSPVAARVHHGLPSFEGRPVLTWSPDWSRDISDQYTRLMDTFDSGSGRISRRQRRRMPVSMTQRSWALFGYKEIERMKAFILEMDGARGEFWLPSGSQDFILIASSQSDSDTIAVESNGYFSGMHPDEEGRRIRISLFDGTELYRVVMAASSDGSGAEILTLNEPLGVDVSPSSVSRIERLQLSRIVGDDITVAWEGPKVARVGLAIKQLNHHIIEEAL